MAHLWIEEDAGYSDAAWSVAPLNGPPLCFGNDGELPRLLDGASTMDAFMIGGGLLITASSKHEELWVLIAAPRGRVKVNRIPTAGVHVLDDRDEILLPDGRRYFFSSQPLAVIELFPSSADRLPCLNCRSSIPEGTPAVRCPGCGGWYHQWPEGSRACWQASQECAACGASIERLSTVEWSPEEL